MPARRRSRPSSTVSISWSERMPEAAYAWSALPSTPGACPSTCSAPSSASFASSASSPRDDAGEVHHLGEAEHALAAHERLEVAELERPPRRLEGRGGDARRRHEEDLELEARRRVVEPVDAVRPEHVRDLVRVGDDRGRPERQDQPRELVGEELRRLDVHVRVDEARDDVAPGGVDRLATLVRADAGDEAVDDRDVGLEPFAREDGQHACRHARRGRRARPRGRLRDGVARSVMAPDDNGSRRPAGCRAPVHCSDGRTSTVRWQHCGCRRPCEREWPRADGVAPDRLRPCPDGLRPDRRGACARSRRRRGGRVRVRRVVAVPVPPRGDLYAGRGRRADRCAAAPQPDRLDPRRRRAVARGGAGRGAVRVGGAGGASGLAPRRVVGGARLLAVAGVLRVAAGDHVRVPRRPAAVAAVAAVRDLRRRLDDAPRRVARDVGEAREPVRGRGESVSRPLARRARLPERPGMARGLREPLRRRGRGANAVPALDRDRAATDALAGVRGAARAARRRVLPRLGLRARRARRRGARRAARVAGCRRARGRRRGDPLPALRDRPADQPDARLLGRDRVARAPVCRRLAARGCRRRPRLDLGRGARRRPRRVRVRAAAPAGAGRGRLALRPAALRRAAARERVCRRRPRGEARAGGCRRRARRGAAGSRAPSCSTGSRRARPMPAAPRASSATLPPTGAP